MTAEDETMTLAELRVDLHRELMSFARRPTRDVETFDTLAARVLHYQARAVPEYGRLVDALGAELDDWREAPLVPTELFREVDLCSLPVGPKVNVTQYRPLPTTCEGCHSDFHKGTFKGFEP